MGEESGSLGTQTAIVDSLKKIKSLMSDKHADYKQKSPKTEHTIQAVYTIKTTTGIDM